MFKLLIFLICIAALSSCTSSEDKAADFMGVNLTIVTSCQNHFDIPSLRGRKHRFLSSNSFFF